MNRKLSFGFLFMVVLFLAFLQGCTTPGPLADCDKIEDQTSKDSCYYTVAKDKLDPSICNKIQDQFRKDYCYGGIGIANEDPSICNKIQTQWIEDICSANVARAINGPQ